MRQKSKMSYLSISTLSNDQSYVMIYNFSKYKLIIATMTKHNMFLVSIDLK